MVVLARMQRVEIGNTIDPKHHRLAIDHKLLDPVLQGGLHDPRVTAGPVMAAARDQAHAVAIALQPQPIAIVFHFVQPVGAGGDGDGFGG